MKLKDKIAVITGGSKGIGKAVAKAFVKEGCHTIICSRNEDSLKNTALELEKFGRIEYIKADISSKEDVRRLRDFVAGRFKGVDILVNNASILGVRTPIASYPEDIWEEVIKINLNAQFFVTKSLLPLLLTSRNGSIINVSSSVGRRGKATWGAYAVSKFGLEGFTQVLADELKSTSVRVNSVNPGGTRTEMRAMAYPEEDPQTLPTPDDIVPVFIYLASDESVGITGCQFDARDWLNKPSR